MHLKLYEYPAPEIRTIAQPLDPTDQSVDALAKGMLDLMYRSSGIGLAAPQVGHLVQLVVLDLSESQDQPLVLINPVIEERQGRVKSPEGCLSLPGLSIEVERSERILFRAFSLNGQEIIEWAEGLQAICIQHELDHLAGRLLLDHLSDFRRGLMIKKYDKLRQRQRRYEKT